MHLARALSRVRLCTRGMAVTTLADARHRFFPDFSRMIGNVQQISENISNRKVDANVAEMVRW